MLRSVVLGVLVFASSCDSTVIRRGDHGGGGGASDDAASGPTTGAGDSSGSSATPPWTVSPEQVFSDVACDDEPLLFIEVWPAAASACVAPPGLDVDDILVLGIEGWDGEPGTFPIDEETPHGVARAKRGLDALTGTLTVEPYVGTPSAISWNLSVGAGRTDLSVCGKLDELPCE